MFFNRLYSRKDLAMPIKSMLHPCNHSLKNLWAVGALKSVITFHLRQTRLGGPTVTNREYIFGYQSASLFKFQSGHSTTDSSRFALNRSDRLLYGGLYSRKPW